MFGPGLRLADGGLDLFFVGGFFGLVVGERIVGSLVVGGLFCLVVGSLIVGGFVGLVVVG